MVPVNPVFLQLNEKRVATSERLTANKALAASLESFVETAPSEMESSGLRWRLPRWRSSNSALPPTRPLCS